MTLKPSHLALTLLLAIIGIDQLLKYCALSQLLSGGMPMITWTLSMNTGYALGIFSSWPNVLVCLLHLLGLIGIYRLMNMIQMPHMTQALILAGGISNLIDRIAHGGVIDYIQLHVFGYYWPWVVNFADLSITIGFVLFLITDPDNPEILEGQGFSLDSIMAPFNRMRGKSRSH